jgi:L-methionine (R)-S-oxide reductase
VDFSILYSEAERIMDSGEGSSASRLQRLCEFLREKAPHYNWFGFYIAEKERRELFLGPFAGEPTEHVRIPFGRGICGQAADSGKAFVVDDVSSASNYLACSIKVRSEIVIPVFTHERKLVGEIDIDSHRTGAFGEEDRIFLERLALLVAPDVEALR